MRRLSLNVCFLLYLLERISYLLHAVRRTYQADLSASADNQPQNRTNNKCNDITSYYIIIVLTYLACESAPLACIDHQDLYVYIFNEINITKWFIQYFLWFHLSNTQCNHRVLSYLIYRSLSKFLQPHGHPKIKCNYGNYMMYTHNL